MRRDEKSTRTRSSIRFDVQRMFSSWKSDFTIKILPDQTIDGKSCHVVETSPKNQSAQAGMNIGKQDFLFR